MKNKNNHSSFIDLREILYQKLSKINLIKFASIFLNRFILRYILCFHTEANREWVQTVANKTQCTVRCVSRTQSTYWSMTKQTLIAENHCNHETLAQARFFPSSLFILFLSFPSWHRIQIYLESLFYKKKKNMPIIRNSWFLLTKMF